MRPLLPLLLLLVCAGAAPAAAQAPAIPEAWAGIWEISYEELLCGQEIPRDSWTESDTLCAGEPFGVDEVGGLVPTCAGTITDDAVDLVCSLEAQLYPGCAAVLTVTVSAGRAGETMEGSFLIEVDYQGPACLVPDQCTVQTFRGTRVAPAPADCGRVPAAPASWGTVKARYGRA